MSTIDREAAFPERLRAAEDRIVYLEKRNRILLRRLSEQAKSLPNLLPKLFRPGTAAPHDERSEAPVDIVVTVRNTFEFLVPCLESVLRNTDVPYRLFLNDNASEDPRTPQYLRKIRDENPDRVVLFLQNRNLGFPDAVNLLLKETTNDVILINADTTVPPGWAARLLWPLRHSGIKVASTAPFTNAASFAAFPRVAAENELPFGMDADTLDKVFQRVKPNTEWIMPYSPGFCMGLSRQALDDVGFLDADTFRPGYGEESDWCYRAARLGYAHVLTANLFVFHKHGATFKRESSAAMEKLIEDHVAILEARYPGFTDEMHDFNDDPHFQALSSFLLFVAAGEAGGGLDVRFVAHAALKEFAEKLTEEDTPQVRITRDPDSGEYALRFSFMGYSDVFFSPNLNWIVKTLHRVNVARICVEAYPASDEARIRRALQRFGMRTGIKPVDGEGNEIYETRP